MECDEETEIVFEFVGEISSVDGLGEKSLLPQVSDGGGILATTPEELGFYACKSGESSGGEDSIGSSTDEGGSVVEIFNDCVECESKFDDAGVRALPLPVEWLLPVSPISSTGNTIAAFNDFFNPVVSTDSTKDDAHPEPADDLVAMADVGAQPQTPTSSKGTHLTAGITILSCSFSLFEDLVDSPNHVSYDLGSDRCDEITTRDDAGRCLVPVFK
jgi:hypothetical protein